MLFLGVLAQNRVVLRVAVLDRESRAEIRGWVGLPADPLLLVEGGRELAGVEGAFRCALSESLGAGLIFLRGAVGEVQVLHHRVAGCVAGQADVLPGFDLHALFQAGGKAAHVVVRHHVAIAALDEDRVACRAPVADEGDLAVRCGVQRLRRATGREVQTIVHVRLLVGATEVPCTAAPEFAEAPGDGLFLGWRHHAGIGQCRSHGHQCGQSKQLVHGHGSRYSFSRAA